jgi:1,4-alpha-glucan branching enzyme
MRAAHAMRFGAELLAGGGVRFALWAPSQPQVTLQHVVDSTHCLERRPFGFIGE